MDTAELDQVIAFCKRKQLRALSNKLYALPTLLHTVADFMNNLEDHAVFSAFFCFVTQLYRKEETSPHNSAAVRLHPLVKPRLVAAIECGSFDKLDNHVELLERKLLDN